MSAAPPQSNRASLLAGLRTGGVRSTSSHIPQTAAPGGSFNISRFPSQQYSNDSEEEDQVLDIPSQFHNYARAAPMTAAVDGHNNRFSSQQQRHGLNPNSAPFNPGFNPNLLSQQHQQAQAFQMQMMQLEIMKLQAVQAQAQQAQLLAQAQRQQQQQQQNRRQSANLPYPASAGPAAHSFDLRTAALSAQIRRSSQTNQGSYGTDDASAVPMTAALGGRFGARTASGRLPSESDESASSVPPTPNTGTTVISGGTSLGNLASNNVTASPSKSDAVSSWRRGGSKGNSVLSNRRIVTTPSLKVSPPPSERSSPPLPGAGSLNASAPKFRPQPLQFSASVSQPLPVVAIDSSDSNDNDDTGSDTSSKSAGSNGSSPTTPSSNEMPLSPREEASKKLYEGLGIGRPRSSVSANGMAIPSVVVNGDIEEPVGVVQPLAPAISLHQRIVSGQPVRQPRGPPGGADELGPKNFATRIRRQAIGGLEVLMDARERRELVEAY